MNYPDIELHIDGRWKRASGQPWSSRLWTGRRDGRPAMLYGGQERLAQDDL